MCLRLAEQLGLEVVPINAANLADLCNAVSDHGCDVGFAQDPDGDRIAFIDENGNAVGEQNSLVLVVKHGRTPGDVVVNIDTTSAIVSELPQLHISKARTPCSAVNARRGGHESVDAGICDRRIKEFSEEIRLLGE